MNRRPDLSLNSRLADFAEPPPPGDGETIGDVMRRKCPNVPRNDLPPALLAANYSEWMKR